jgi:hypothetical protein
MRLKTESERGSAARLAIIPLLILTLLAPLPLAAQSRTSYVDLAAAGLGAATGALHLRGGFEFPVDAPWSAVLEPGFHAAGTRDMLSLQIDLSGSVRWRPAGPLGCFAGVGAGVAAAYASAAQWTDDPEEYSLLGLKVFALAEAGWTFGKVASPIRVEPYIRSAFAFGPEILRGTAPGARQGTEWGSALSFLLGLRVVWMPPAR